MMSRLNGAAREPPLPSQLLHVRLELVILVLHRVEEEALGQVGAALAVVHLIDQVGDLPHHVLERAFQATARGDLPEQRFHHGEEIAVERDRLAAAGFNGAHLQAPKLLTALGSSACISRKFCAPVSVSIVSTRFWTPDSFSWPPAPCTWRYRSIRQPIVALS